MVQAVLVLEGDTARTHGCQMADDGDPTWGTAGYLRKVVKQTRDRADSLQAALVKACDCTKCRWDNYAKGCPECLGSHYDDYRLRWYNMWLVKALEKFGKKASSIKFLGVYFQAFSTNTVVVQYHRGRIVFFNRFYRSQGLRTSNIEPILPLKESKTKTKIRKDVAKNRKKAKGANQGSKEAQETEEPSMIPGPCDHAAVAGRRKRFVEGLWAFAGRGRSL